MVAFALVVNLGRYEGWVIIHVGIAMAYFLHKKWFSGGPLPINFSH
jgi:hydrogenase maturation factor